MKQPVHFRLSQEAVALLQRLANADGISRTAMLEIAIREAARKRGLHADTGVQTQDQPGPTERD
ncbi:MAG TPA: ribbon-helix-helix protein, CopG family [Ktedonobacterales bacterium]|nr:ribbon-helix-helix protein, CopG family [Ktedonobacterales bacterium]